MLKRFSFPATHKFGYSLLGLILLLVFGPFLIPVAPLEGTRPARAFADADSQFITLNGLEVHYKTAGQGEYNFILLHGFASSLFSWREVMAPLSERGFVIAFDRPAFGLTERPIAWDGVNPYSSAFQVDLVLGLMNQFELEQTILIGNSAGGAIAALTALDHPEHVQALILVDPAVYVGSGTPRWLKPLFNTPQANHLGPLFARMIRNWGEDFAASAWHDPTRLTPQIWDGYSLPLQIDNWDRALWELTNASSESGIIERLEELSLPVLVITGDDDRIVPTTDSIRLSQELPNASLAVIKDCGHVPQEECPLQFMQAVDNFLTSRLEQ